MASFVNALFGKAPTLEEQVKKWRSNLRAQERKLERQVVEIQREENKVKQAIRAHAKKGEIRECKTLAKELVQSRKAVERIYNSKAQLKSMGLQLTQQLSTQRMMKTMKESTQMMQMMNKLIKLPELAQDMQAMQKEMIKSELIQETIDDTLDEGEEVSEAADVEIDRVLADITKDIMVGASNVPTNELRKSHADLEALPHPKEADMERRLQALRQ